MSRAYRMRLSESLRRHIQVDDGICSSLELLDILPRDQMAALLEHELAGRGFERQDDGQWIRVDDGVEIRIDPKLGTVTVTARTSEDVEVEKTTEVNADTDTEVHDRERGLVGLRASLESELEARKKELQGKVTEKLEGKLGDLRQELDKISNRVTAEALKRKAATLGEVQEVSEDVETGSLTIRVKI